MFFLLRTFSGFLDISYSRRLASLFWVFWLTNHFRNCHIKNKLPWLLYHPSLMSCNNCKTATCQLHDTAWHYRKHLSEYCYATFIFFMDVIIFHITCSFYSRTQIKPSGNYLDVSCKYRNISTGMHKKSSTVRKSLLQLHIKFQPEKTSGLTYAGNVKRE